MTSIALLASIALAAANGPAGAADAAPAATAVSLKPFRSCSEMVDYARNRLPKFSRDRYITGDVIPMAAAPRTEADKSAGTGAAAQGGALTGSQTNVQEAGIDEPDIVKTDAAGRIFAIAGGALHAVDGAAQTPSRLGSLKLPGAEHQLFLIGDRALVVSQAYGDVRDRPVKPTVVPPDSDAPLGTAEFAPAGEPITVLTEVDVSDPAAMRIVRSDRVEGSFVSARLTGSTARVVISSAPRAAALYRLRSRSAGYRPAVVSRRGGEAAGPRRPLYGCSAVGRPVRNAGVGMLSVLTIDMQRGLPAVDTDAVMTSAQTIYASAGALYVATTDSDQSGSVLTAIHKFDTSLPNRTDYRGSGSVRGHLLNQFSLSEHDGALRAATTEQPSFMGDVVVEPEQSESAVTVLREQDGKLVQVGRVAGMGEGERIYSVRFIGDRGYVVTFRQTDPLYTLDLSDPTQPRVTGELKIPGYSAYLHPVGEHLLLGIGQDADSNGRIQGTQVSLFDVSDAANPRQLDKRTLARGSSSEVEYDHHALLYWAATKLAVLPLQRYDASDGDYVAGAVGLRIEGERLVEAGRIGHESASVRRSLVLGERLFTLSERGLKVHTLDTLEDRGAVNLPG